MSHKIAITADRRGICTFSLKRRLRSTVKTALVAEGITADCEINILLTDDAGIQEVNRQMRDIDRPTDVLSFPMFDLTPGEHPDETDADPASGRIPLGDMCISVERAHAQAAEYGHSFEREICYLCVHSVLHLLGYDHLDEGEMKRQMRAREEAIMQELNLER